MISAKLRELKERKGLTNHEISELSGVPESSLARILSGQTDNPSYQSVADIVRALDGSMDELSGIAPPPAPAPAQDLQPLLDELRALSAQASANAAAIEQIRAMVSLKDKWLSRMFVYCCVLTALILLWVIADACIPATGFIR